jgi:hypothetical protein
MIPEQLKHLLESIGATIDDDSHTSHERESRLWNAAQLFWKHAFPAGITPEDRHHLWVGIVGECNAETRTNGGKILDVLEWPATGKPPSWI